MELIYSKDCSRIKEINLGKNAISQYAIEKFYTCNWSNLTSLFLWDNQISDKGCKYLSRAHLENLKILGLGNTMKIKAKIRSEAQGSCIW